MPLLLHTWRKWSTALVDRCGGALTVAKTSSSKETCQDMWRPFISLILAYSVTCVRKFSKQEKVWGATWIMFTRTKILWNTTSESSYCLSLFAIHCWLSLTSVLMLNVLQRGAPTTEKSMRKSRRWLGGFLRERLFVMSVGTATTPSRIWRNMLKPTSKPLAIPVPFVRSTSRLGTAWILMSAPTIGKKGKTNLICLSDLEDASFWNKEFSCPHPFC